jgi:hypothetical protein
MQEIQKITILDLASDRPPSWEKAGSYLTNEEEIIIL